MAKKKKNDGLSLNNLKVIADRFNVTAREARDIVTAVSTLGRTFVDPNVKGRGLDITKRGKKVGKTFDGSETKSKAARNLAKQVGEVYTAATKGKSGTKSAKIKSVKSRSGSGLSIGEKYATETKRKQGGKK
jgi:hypothetical protein